MVCGRRGFIAVDETVVSNLGGRAYLWAARDVENGEVVSVQVSRSRGLREWLRFLERVKRRCTDRPKIYMACEGSGNKALEGDVRCEEPDRAVVLQGEEEDKTVQRIPPQHTRQKRQRGG